MRTGVRCLYGAISVLGEHTTLISLLVFLLRTLHSYRPIMVMSTIYFMKVCVNYILLKDSMIYQVFHNRKSVPFYSENMLDKIFLSIT